jgi:hypothetical protein
MTVEEYLHTLFENPGLHEVIELRLPSYEIVLTQADIFND